MVVSLGSKYKRLLRAISVIVICLFLSNDISFGIQAVHQASITHTLSVPSRFNDISVYSANNSLTDGKEPALADALQEEAGLVYLNHLMGKILAGWGSIMSERAIRTIAQRHFTELEKEDIRLLDVKKEGKTFSLTCLATGGKEVVLRFYDPKDSPDGETAKSSISISGSKIRVVIESKDPLTEEEPVTETAGQSLKEEPSYEAKDPFPVQQGKTLIDSVFEGGGAKGVAYGGALDVIAERDMWFRKIAGTSAGAITASLIAVGYDHKELRNIIMGTNFNDFKDLKWGFLPTWANLLMFGGLYWGKFFEKWIDKKFNEKLGYSPTMKDLPIPLTVIASNITDQQMLVIDKDTAPDLKVSTAVRMSMGIPFFFDVFKWFGFYASKIRARRVVDGGLLSNFPLFVLENDGQHGVPVLGFRLDEVKEKKPPKGFWAWVLALVKKLPVVNIAAAVLSTGMDAHDNRHIEDDDWARIVNIPVDVGTTDFDLSKEKKEELMMRGRIATEKVLDKKLAEAHRQRKIKAAARDKDEGEGEVQQPLQDDERKVQDLIDGLVIMALEADLNNSKVILGLDTSLIPDLQRSTSAMNNLLKVLRDMKMKNVIVCQSEGAALYSEIAKVREDSDISKSNIVVVGEKDVLSSGAFDALKAENEEEVGAYFAEVIVPEGFPDDGDTELIRIISQAIQEASKGDRASRRKEFFLKAEPMGIDKLVDKLERQTERFSA